MNLYEKAKELGELIASSEEMARLKMFEAALEADSAAKTLMKEYKQLQIELLRSTKEGKSANIIDSIKEKLLSKQKELNDYEITRGYLDAKAAFDKLMRTVNEVVMFTITGDLGCSSEKCGSCGKGCK